MASIDQRTFQLIEKMIERPFNTAQHLMKQLSLSKSQVEYAVSKANVLLQEAGKTPIEIGLNNFILAESSRNYFLDFLSKEDVFSVYELSGEERKKYIFLMTLYYHEEYLSINHFLDALQVGKTTLISDMKKLEEELQRLHIEISYSRKEGYRLQGDEAEIRYYLMRIIFEDFSKNNAHFLYDYFLYRESTVDKKRIFAVVESELNHYHINIVENRMNEFCYMLVFLLPRLNKTWAEFYQNYSFQTFFETKEYQFSTSLLAQFQIENKYAKLYVCGWMLGMAMGDAKQNSPDYSIIDELVDRIFERFELLSGIRFKDERAAKQQLYSHFRPVYYRLFFHLPIVNVLHTKIVQEFPDMYQIVQETMKPIEVLFGTEIPNEEVSFLTLHFASLIDEYDEYQVQQKIGVIVCPNGIGSSAIVYNELKSVFPEMILIGPMETNALETISQSYDMVFTTVPNIRLYALKKPVFVVNPIMSIDEKYRLVQAVQNEGNPQYEDYRVEDLLAIIKKHGTITEVSALKKELNDYLQGRNNKSHKHASKVVNRNKQAEFNLLDILKPEFIQLQISSRSWEEALYVAAAPLVDAGVITRHYIEKIIQTTRNEGPYMVITEKVALPHARPEDGTLKVGLGITALKDEVVILGKTPVKYIFTLSAVDNKKHLSAIAELVSFLDRPEFFTLLDQAEDPQEVYAWVEQHIESD